MREPTIARNYAETLLELARRAGDYRAWGTYADEVVAAIQRDPKLRMFLESPKVAATEKNRIIGKAFDPVLPRNFVRFLQSLVTHRRQLLLPQIVTEYHNLVDEVEGRVHASVQIAREADDAERKVIADRLSKAIGKEVVPHFYLNPSILGGVVVRVGDKVLDGSVRRRLATLKSRMIGRPA
jgi:F-type H+-transporting ATPase subunit delta